MSNPRTFLQIHPADNVLVALIDFPKGSSVQHNGQTIVLADEVAAKHKFTIAPVPTGGAVTMYGVLVGSATQDIPMGGRIGTHNLRHEAEAYGIEKRQPYQWQPPDTTRWQHRTFLGYHRADGSVGTRNYWLVIPLVFCENRNIMIMKDAFERELGFAQPEVYRTQVRGLVEAFRQGALEAFDQVELPQDDLAERGRSGLFPNVDGIKFLTHEMGCGGTNQDAQALAELFAGCIVNPNVAGVTVLSLGCQKTQFDALQKAIRVRNPAFDRPLLYFDQQTYGTEHALLSAAIRETFKGLVAINRQTRQPAPLRHLSIGLKCGGSDGFSGISANPAVGHLSDLVVSLGGQTLLAEFPELCGVEQELVNRCVEAEKAVKFIRLMRTYSAEAEAVGAGFDMNPSAGNIKDGLITDAIKSAGAAKKGGNAPVADVLDYAETPTRPGLHLLLTPGNDVLATTGMAGSGATIILFTTGLGTPTGNPIAPTVKISTNSRLAMRMPDIIDFDSGPIVAGEQSIAENGEAMLEWVIGLASGIYRTKAEQLGQDDFIPWRRGVNL
jgi:altronate hydrolase